jgi:hypothetical protein
MSMTADIEICISEYPNGFIKKLALEAKVWKEPYIRK